MKLRLVWLLPVALIQLGCSHPAQGQSQVISSLSERIAVFQNPAIYCHFATSIHRLPARIALAEQWGRFVWWTGQSASAIQAVSAVGTLILTAALTYVTWKYVRLTSTIALLTRSQFENDVLRRSR
jgi:hypothetical protein